MIFFVVQKSCKKVNCKFLFSFSTREGMLLVTKIRITCPVQPKLPQSMCVFLYFSTTRFGMSSFWVQKNRVSWKLNCMRAVKFRKNKEQIPSWKICVSQDFLDPIKTVYLRGLHIAHLETTYLEALLYLVLFLGFRVDFFFHLCMIYKIALPWISLA